MTIEQINSKEYIVQSITEAIKAAIQTMAMASATRVENTGLRMSGPIMKQPAFYFELQRQACSAMKLQTRGKEHALQL